MFYRIISFFACISMAVVIATKSIDPESITGSDPEVNVYYFTADKSESLTTGSAPAVEKAAAVDLATVLEAADHTVVIVVAVNVNTSVAATGDSGTTTATQTHSDHSPTPASATTTMALCPTLQPDDPAVSRLRNLTEEEKGRRLREAAKLGNVTELQRLVSAGADQGSKRTALHWAAMAGDVEAARCLVFNGASVSAEDLWLQTPLHGAARNGAADVARLLLASGANPNVRDGNGWTPLHEAADKGHTETAAALLEAGADGGLTNNFGKTPLDIARDHGRQQLIDMLQ